MSAVEQQSTVEKWGNAVLKVHGDGSVGTCFVIDAERGLLWTCAHVLILPERWLEAEEIGRMRAEQLREELEKRDLDAEEIDRMSVEQLRKELKKRNNWSYEGPTCPKYRGATELYGQAPMVLIGMAAARGEQVVYRFRAQVLRSTGRWSHRPAVGDDNLDAALLIIREQDSGAGWTPVLRDADGKLAPPLLHANGAELTALPLGDSDSVRLGEESVVAHGYPQATGGDLAPTHGFLSQKPRRFAMNNVENGGGEYLAYDGNIFPGHSGGPVITASGEVIGWNVRDYGPNAVGFNGLRPVSEMLRVLREWCNGDAWLAEQVFGTAGIPADIRAALRAKRSCFMIEMIGDERLHARAAAMEAAEAAKQAEAAAEAASRDAARAEAAAAEAASREAVAMQHRHDDLTASAEALEAEAREAEERRKRKEAEARRKREAAAAMLKRRVSPRLQQQAQQAQQAAQAAARRRRRCLHVRALLRWYSSHARVGPSRHRKSTGHNVPVPPRV